MESKVRIKMGEVEVEYTGSEGFLRKELLALLEAVVKLHGGGGKERVSSSDSSGARGKMHGAKVPVTTAVIAGKLGGKKGPDLAFAASAKLGLGDGRDRFSRDEILREMKTATLRYNANMAKNLTVNLKSLVNKKYLNHLGGDDYALADDGRKAAEQAFA